MMFTSSNVPLGRVSGELSKTWRALSGAGHQHSHRSAQHIIFAHSKAAATGPLLMRPPDEAFNEPLPFSLYPPPHHCLPRTSQRTATASLTFLGKCLTNVASQADPPHIIRIPYMNFYGVFVNKLGHNIRYSKLTRFNSKYLFFLNKMKNFGIKIIKTEVASNLSLRDTTFSN